MLYGKGHDEWIALFGLLEASLDVSDFRVFRSSPCIYSFDREVDFTITYNDHENAFINAISIGEDFRRMGEIDLIFENARLKWVMVISSLIPT